MTVRPFACALLGAVLGSAASATNFSVSGPGGSIPDCPLAGGTWNAAPTWLYLTRSVTVPVPVASISAVRIQGLYHTYRGDLHAFLTSPNGTRFNFIVRPGSDGTTSGNAGNYSIGDYVFVESGGASIEQGGANLIPGTYDQYLNVGPGQWTSGTFPIQNLPLGQITGPAGTWSLSIVDWWTGDIGWIDGWTLEGSDTPNLTTFCEPGSGGIIACPCANPPSGADRGCDNFGAHTGGASISMTGSPSLGADTVTLAAAGENNTAFTVFFQGRDPVSSTGIVHGAGVRCVTQTLKRLYNGNASGGAIARPGMGGPTVSSRSAALGDPIVAGQARHYFTIYRDPSAAGPCGNTSSTVNLSNALTLVWGP